MAGTTSRGYPYPQNGDPVDVAGDMQALAEAVDADLGSFSGLPSQTGNAGKYLSTNGTSASWQSVTTDPTPTVFLMMGA